MVGKISATGGGGWLGWGGGGGGLRAEGSLTWDC